jgi:hypothetical protein
MLLLLLLPQQVPASLQPPPFQPLAQYLIPNKNKNMVLLRCRRPHLVPTGTFTHRRVAAAAAKPNHAAAAAAAPAGLSQPASPLTTICNFM